MRKALIAVTLGEVVLLVGVLAGYLLAIAGALARVSSTLAKITFGVRAIESQTEPIGRTLAQVNDELARTAAALEDAARSKTPSG